jgi:integrase
VRSFLLDRAEAGLLRLGDRSWGEVVRLVPAERLGGWLAAGLASDTGRDLYAEARDRVVDRLLHQPIGALGGPGPDDAARRVTEALGDPVWDWISSRIPEVAARVRVAERVEDKIVAFPLDEVERLIREVSGRELNLIVRLGYLLGAFIGVALVLVRHVIG